MSDQAFIQFSTHAVTIHKVEDSYRCFKFTGDGKSFFCDYDSFSNSDDAIDFVVKPFPEEFWEVRVD